ncbi:mucin-2-like isoform X2 [Pecten maximus]|nr:mucin-2-like isoform X2 [Pecten maximus]
MTDSKNSVHPLHVYQIKSTQTPGTNGKHTTTTASHMSPLKTPINSHPVPTSSIKTSHPSSHMTSQITSHMASISPSVISKQTHPLISTTSSPLDMTSSMSPNTSPVSVAAQSTKLSSAEETITPTDTYTSPIGNMTSSSTITFPKESTTKKYTSSLEPLTSSTTTSPAQTASLLVMSTSEHEHLHHTKYRQPITARSGGFVDGVNAGKFVTSPDSEGGGKMHLQKLLSSLGNTKASLQTPTITTRTPEGSTTGGRYFTPEYVRVTPESETTDITTPKYKPSQTIPTSVNRDKSESVTKSATGIQQLHSDTSQLGIDPHTASSGVKQVGHIHNYNTLLEFFREIDSGERDKAMDLLQNFFNNVKESGSLTSNPARTGNVLHGVQTIASTEKSADPGKSSDVTTRVPERQSVIPTQNNNETLTSPVTDTGGTNETEKGRQSITVVPNESNLCPGTKPHCEDKTCHVYDTLRRCMLCICDDVGLFGDKTPNQTTPQGQPDNSPVCRPIPEDCADECLFLDGTNYFCPVCRCEQNDLKRQRPDAIMTTDTCPPLNESCPHGCEGLSTETFCPQCKG